MSGAFADVSAVALADLLSLHGRRAVVTGGAQGLGLAIARRLAEAGAQVAIADLDLDRAASAAAGIADARGASTIGVRMDVSDSASVESATSRVVAEFGGVDIWINNAGVFPSASVLDMSDEQWDHVFAVNTRGVRNGARAAARHMPKGGVIINVVSTAGFRGSAPGLAAYVGSKYAVRGMTKQMALELAPRGIRVLGVAPTFVPTEGNSAAVAAALAAMGDAGIDASNVPSAMSQSLIGRVGTPDDIARVVLFAASDLATIMTGSTLLADAGETI